MSRESEAVFTALFGLEDVREILRESAPGHELSDEQKEIVKKSLERIRRSLDNLEELL